MPVPPRVTGTVPRLMAGVVVPVVTVRGAVAVTLVTVPEPALAATEPSWPLASMTTACVPVRVLTPRMPAMKVLAWPVIVAPDPTAVVPMRTVLASAATPSFPMAML